MNFLQMYLKKDYILLFLFYIAARAIWPYILIGGLALATLLALGVAIGVCKHFWKKRSSHRRVRADNTERGSHSKRKPGRKNSKKLDNYEHLQKKKRRLYLKLPFIARK